MSLPTPNYILGREIHWVEGNNDIKVVKSGSFIRPIELCYVPAHVLEDRRWRFFNDKYDVFCYSRYGIIQVPKNAVVKV